MNFVLRRLLAARRVCKPRWSVCRFDGCSAIAALLANAIKAACLSIVLADSGRLLPTEVVSAEVPETGGSRIRNLLGHGLGTACDVGSEVDSVDVRYVSEGTLLHSRARRGGNDAHTRWGRNVFRETATRAFAVVPL